MHPLAPRMKSGEPWPRHVNRVREIRRLVYEEGFKLVVILGDRDQPIYRLMKDGEISPSGTVEASAARKADHQYFETVEKLADGTQILELSETKRAQRRATQHGGNSQ